MGTDGPHHKHKAFLVSRHVACYPAVRYHTAQTRHAYSTHNPHAPHGRVQRPARSAASAAPPSIPGTRAPEVPAGLRQITQSAPAAEAAAASLAAAAPARPSSLPVPAAAPWRDGLSSHPLLHPPGWTAASRASRPPSHP